MPSSRKPKARDATHNFAHTNSSKLIDRNQTQDRHLDQPDRLTKPKTGKKEIALEEARRAHHDSDWGDDLAPLEDRSLN